MSKAQFNFDLVVRADVARAKAGMKDMGASMLAFSAETEKASRAARRKAADLEALAAATASAISGQDRLAAAERRAQEVRAKALQAPLAVPQIATAPIQAAFKATETAAESLKSAVAGLTVSVGAGAQEFLESANASRAYQASLDDIRASFNPLFAASRQYEQQLERIRQAELDGAISAREAADARLRAAAQMTPVGPAGAAGVSPFYISNITAQMNDIGMMTFAGQSPVMLALQQGTQLGEVMMQVKAQGGGLFAALARGFASVLSPVNLLTIGIVGLGAAGIQAMATLLPKTKSFDDALAELSSSVDSYKSAITLARGPTSELTAEFSSAGMAAREFAGALADIERRTAGRAARAAVSRFGDEQSLFLPDLDWRDQGANAELFEVRRARDTRRLRGLFGVDASAVSHGEIGGVLDAMTSFQAAEGLEAQIAAGEELLVLFTALAERSGEISESEDAALRPLAEAVAALRRLKALDDNEAGKTRIDQMVLAYQQEAELQAASLQFGRDGVEVDRIRARHAREMLDIRLEDMGIKQDSAEWDRAQAALAARQAEDERALHDARRDWLADQDDRLAGISHEIALIDASNAERLRANALAEAEIEIRKRKLQGMEAEEHRARAIARAEAETTLERQRAFRELYSTGVMDGYDIRIAAERDPHLRAGLEAEKEYARVLAQSKDAGLAAASAAQVRARALADLRQEQSDYLRSQGESLQQLQLELALIGQTEAVRARVLALAQAERDIRRLGIGGEAAETVRRNAVAQSELAREIAAQADAWQRVQSAGEQAIDAVLDKLRSGDLKGAFAGLVDEIEGMFFDLSIRNPLKNLILGTDLGTWDDIGGFGGIWGRLTGASRVDEKALSLQGAMPVQSMAVTAANVMIGGVGIASLLGNLSGGTAIGGLGMGGLGMGGLAGAGDVQSQVWSFFAAKGLAPHQIAAIMGNVSAESGFDPFARGDNGKAFGLFQWNDRRNALFDFIGGQQNLGDIQAQLEFAWHELMTSENGPFRRLMASTSLYDATHAFTGFERPSGYDASNPTSAMHWDRRLAAAEAAMAKFEAQVYATSDGVGQLGSGAANLGTGLQGFGAQLGGLFENIGAQHGPLGMFAGGLLSGLIGMLPGFEVGSWTGAGADHDVAGLVHRNEFVFDAAATRRIGVRNLEALRQGKLPGYMRGGEVVMSGGAPIAPAFASSPSPSAAPSDPTRAVFEINVSGTGTAEIRQGVMAAMDMAFDQFTRNVLPTKIMTVVNDRWSV